MKKIYELLFKQIKTVPNSEPESPLANIYYKSKFYMCKNISESISANIKPIDVFPHPIKIENKKLVRFSNILDFFGGNSFGTLFFIFIVWQILGFFLSMVSGTFGIEDTSLLFSLTFCAATFKVAFIWSFFLNIIGLATRTIIKKNIKKQFSLNFKNEMLKESLNIVEGLRKINGYFINKNEINSKELLEFIEEYKIQFQFQHTEIKRQKERLEKYLASISYNFDKDRNIGLINPFDLAKEKMASEILETQKNMLRKKRGFFAKSKEDSLKVKKITKEEKSDIDFNNQLEHLKNKIEKIKAE